MCMGRQPCRSGVPMSLSSASVALPLTRGSLAGHVELTDTDVHPTVNDTPYEVKARVSVAEILDVHRELSALRSHAPSEITDPHFAELMRMSISSSGENTDDLIHDHRVEAVLPDLRRFYASGSYQRELAHSLRVINASDPHAAFAEVPYYENYRKLLAFEVGGTLASVNPRPQRVLMIGCGPMPITLVFLSEMLQCEVSGIDISPEACTLARKFCRTLGTDVTVHETDVLDFYAYEQFDVVLLGASVGLDKELRLRIIKHLSEGMASGSALVVRTAHGMRRLLFPQVDPADLEGFECQYLIQPMDRVVNSMIIARKT
ncbi:methyltransferase domain-containing protein [Pseudonocardiaceae bacterium YIM PH 21723]|nr:methyltransferase domain-containing protein [Pseudonocardiaceae bacterium YIM PH 21723]